MAKPLTDYLWIVDGHNLVLNVPELTRLHSHDFARRLRHFARGGGSLSSSPTLLRNKRSVNHEE